VTYQTPQMKYSKNIIADSRALICNCTQSPLSDHRFTSARNLDFFLHPDAGFLYAAPLSHRSMGFFVPAGGWKGIAIFRPSPADA
jgi:hypothetical protein